MNNINEKTVNRRTFKEVVSAKLGELCERLDVQIDRNLARATFYRSKPGYEGYAQRFEHIANGLIDARHEAMSMGLDIENGGEL